MNGIYPRYIGPTQRSSAYPNWIDPDGTFIVIDETDRGGGGSSKNSRPTDPALMRARQEDAELLAIVMCAIRIIQ